MEEALSREIKQLKLWPAQKLFIEHGPTPIFFLGGIGSGKTYIGCMKILALLDEYPGSRAVIVRQKFNQLRKTILPTVMKMLPPNAIARRNDNEGMLKLANGSELLFMHLDREDSIDNLKSLEINFCYVDQCEDISALAWDTLLERLGRWSGATKRWGWPHNWRHRNRLGEAIPPRYALASGYSPGYDHWLTARFWEMGVERGLYRGRGYVAINGSTRDNMALSEEYVGDRLAQGAEYVKRFVDATDWGAKEGRIFTIEPESIIEYSEELFLKMKRTMRLHRGLDHGEAAPTCCLWYATDDLGNVIVYREYHVADKVVSDHRSAIYELSRDDGFGNEREPPRYYSNLADPAIFAKNRGRTVNNVPTFSVADEYAERRIVDPKTAINWAPANNDEAMTVNRVREYLKKDKRNCHPFDRSQRNMPRLYFMRRSEAHPFGVHQALVDIRSAKREEVGMALDGTKLFGEKRDEKVPDHALDVVRYIIGSRPALGPVAPTPPPEPGTIRYADYEKLMVEEDARLKAEFESRFQGRSKMGY